MKAGIYFTGSGPILLLTSHESLNAPPLIQKLAAKGIKKFIAYEVPVEGLEKKYGHHYQAVLGDLHQQDDLRVLDYDGHHVFNLFDLKDLGVSIVHET